MRDAECIDIDAEEGNARLEICFTGQERGFG